MARFENKRVLIMGGTSGIGLAGAKRILAEGGTIIATGQNPDRIDDAQRQLGDSVSVSLAMPLTPQALACLEAALTAGGLMHLT